MNKSTPPQRFFESSFAALVRRPQKYTNEEEKTKKKRPKKKQRNKKQVASALKNLEKAANTESNLIPEIIKAIKNDITLGEISDTFRKIFGEH